MSSPNLPVLIAEVRRLRSVLVELADYATHGPSCAARASRGSRPCDCGLDVVMQQLNWGTPVEHEQDVVTVNTFEEALQRALETAWMVDVSIPREYAMLRQATLIVSFCKVMWDVVVPAMQRQIDELREKVK